MFSVTAASPNSDTCTVTSSGTCFTDGAGSHANSERCTIAVNQDVVLTATQFSTERYYDYLTVGSTRFSGSGAGLTGTFVTAGTTISWRSDGSVTYPGFTVCGAALPPPPPGAVFQIVSSAPDADTCTVSPDGRCFTDGAGNHGNNERCTIRVAQAATLSVPQFQTESFYDTLTVGGIAYSGSGNGLGGTSVAAGSIITWSSDYSVTSGGFTVCA